MTDRSMQTAITLPPVHSGVDDAHQAMQSGDARRVDALPPVGTTAGADMVNHPPHYTAGGIECIDAIEAATVGLTGIEAACTANAIKYLWRWKFKGGKQDLDKAVWYIQHIAKKQ